MGNIIPQYTTKDSMQIRCIFFNFAQVMWNRQCRLVIKQLGNNNLETCRQWSKDCWGSQQSFDHCLHVSGHLRHRACVSWSRRRLCETDKVCNVTHFEYRTKMCRNFHSIVSLRGHFEIYNNNKSFSSMSQSQSIGWVKRKADNNCQTVRIVTKYFV